MLKRGIHIVVMCMIYLILVMPIYSSFVFAEITSFSMTGRDKVLNVRKADDISIFNVTARISGDSELGPNQLAIFPTNLIGFACTFNNKTLMHSCTKAVTETLDPGFYTYTVKLFDDLGIPLSGQTADLQIFVDDTAPDVLSFNAEPNQSKIDISFSAQDPNIGGSCAGLKTIEFLVNGVKNSEYEINQIKNCGIFSNKTIIEIPVTGTETKTICARAVDNLKHKSNVEDRICKNVTIDLSTPTLDDIKVVFSGTRTEIKFTKNQPALVDVIATIKEDKSLNIETVKADLSAISERPEAVNYASLKPVDCIPIAGETELYECKWSNVLIYLTSSKNVTFAVEAEDMNKNKMQATKSVSFVFDSAAPVVNSIKSEKVDEQGLSWVSPAELNEISAEITEDSGLNNLNLVLNLESFGPQNVSDPGASKTLLRPNECVEGWTCYWRNIKVLPNLNPGQALNLNFAPNSFDDAGNQVIGRTTTVIYYDNKAPEITDFFTPIPCPVTGETLDITINATDEHSGGVKAVVAAPLHSFDVFPKEFECEEIERNKFVCEIRIDNLVSSYVNEDFNITLVDVAGNKLETTYNEITGEMPEVCEAAETVPPNLINVDDVEYQPYQGLDRKLASEFPHPLYIIPKLRNLAPRAAIQKMDFVSCTSEDAVFSENLIVNEFDFEDPILSTKVNLKNISDTTKETIDVSCTMNFVMRSGSKIYQLPEEETFNFEVELYGTPFGEVNDAMQSKIDDIKKEISDLNVHIEKMDKANAILGTFCTIAEMVARTAQILGAVKAVLWAVFTILLEIPFTKGAAKAYKPLCGIIDSIQYYAQAYLWNPSSLAKFNIGSAVRILCSYYTCKMSDSNNFIEAFIPTQDLSDPDDWTSHKRGSRYTFEFDEDMEQNKPKDYDWAILLSTAGLLSYDWDPYKSEDVAWAFLCVPGLLYNFKKKKQLLCMEARCIEDNAKGVSALSLEDCEKMYQTRECVYVQSAAIKMVDRYWFKIYAQSFFEQVLKEGSNLLIARFAHGICDKAYSETGGGDSGSGGQTSGGSSSSQSSSGGNSGGTGSSSGSPGGNEEKVLYNKDAPENSAGCDLSSEDKIKDTALGVACSIMVTALLTSDLSSWFDVTDWTSINKYDLEVNDPDFCGPYE